MPHTMFSSAKPVFVLCMLTESWFSTYYWAVSWLYCSQRLQVTEKIQRFAYVGTFFHMFVWSLNMCETEESTSMRCRCLWGTPAAVPTNQSKPACLSSTKLKNLHLLLNTKSSSKAACIWWSTTFYDMKLNLKVFAWSCGEKLFAQIKALPTNECTAVIY